VTFVASWLKHGVAETRAELGGAAIREAAERAVILWPEELESEPGGACAWRGRTVTGGKRDGLGGKAGPDRPGAEGADAGG
jgi:hypothetical protein